MTEEVCFRPEAPRSPKRRVELGTELSSEQLLVSRLAILRISQVRGFALDVRASLLNKSVPNHECLLQPCQEVNADSPLLEFQVVGTRRVRGVQLKPVPLRQHRRRP